MSKDIVLSELDKLSDDAKGYLRALVKKNVAALATDEVFALRDKSGQIRAFKHTLELSDQNGGLVQPVRGGPFVISAQGYEMINEATGASVIHPKTLTVDGKTVGNPYIKRDPNTSQVLEVHARAVAFKYSSKGIPMARDWTTILDIKRYRALDLISKARKYPQAFKVLPTHMEPTSDDGETWACTVINDEINLWYNTSHAEVLSWLKLIIGREKKALDFAQTFAARNASKHLHALQRVPGQVVPGSFDSRPINVWNLTVFCWRPIGDNVIRWNQSEYENLQANVTAMIEGPPESDLSKALDYRKGIVSEDVQADGDNDLEDEVIDDQIIVKNPEYVSVEISGGGDDVDTEEHPTAPPEDQPKEQSGDQSGDQSSDQPIENSVQPAEGGGEPADGAADGAGKTPAKKKFVSKDDLSVKADKRGNQTASLNDRRIMSQFNTVRDDPDMSPYLQRAMLSLKIPTDRAPSVADADRALKLTEQFLVEEAQ